MPFFPKQKGLYNPRKFTNACLFILGWCHTPINKFLYLRLSKIKTLITIHQVSFFSFWYLIIHHALIFTWYKMLESQNSFISKRIMGSKRKFPKLRSWKRKKGSIQEKSLHNALNIPLKKRIKLWEWIQLPFGMYCCSWEIWRWSHLL